MQLDPQTDILGLIDVQPTFMPGGELPIADGDGIIPVINRLLRRFDHAFATQDWHPAEPCLVRQFPSRQTTLRHH